MEMQFFLQHSSMDAFISGNVFNIDFFTALYFSLI